MNWTGRPENVDRAAVKHTADLIEQYVIGNIVLSKKDHDHAWSVLRSNVDHVHEVLMANVATKKAEFLRSFIGTAMKREGTKELTGNRFTLSLDGEGFLCVRRNEDV